MPIPPLELRIGESKAEWFCKSGQEDVERMMKVLADAGIPFSRFARALEFGWSSGRLIRCLHCHAHDREIWGVDIASGHILWCQQHLELLRFAPNTTAPHLPFEDRTCDLVYAGSVFGHLDDLADARCLELRRILKPGGVRYATVLDSDSLAPIEAGQDRNGFFRMIAGSRSFREFNARRGRMFVVGRSLFTCVFHDTAYLVHHLGRMFEVLALVPKSYRDLQAGIPPR